MMIEFSASITNKSVSEPGRAPRCPAGGTFGQDGGFGRSFRDNAGDRTHTSRVGADSKFHY